MIDNKIYYKIKGFIRKRQPKISSEMLEDITHNTLEKAIKYKAEKYSYICDIAKGQISESYRKQQALLIDMDETFCEEHNLMKEEPFYKHLELQDLLNKINLTKTQKKVLKTFIKCYGEYDDLHKKLKMNKNTVRSATKNIRAAINYLIDYGKPNENMYLSTFKKNVKNKIDNKE